MSTTVRFRVVSWDEEHGMWNGVALADGAEVQIGPGLVGMRVGATVEIIATPQDDGRTSICTRVVPAGELPS